MMTFHHSSGVPILAPSAVDSYNNDANGAHIGRGKKSPYLPVRTYR